MACAYSVGLLFSHLFIRVFLPPSLIDVAYSTTLLTFYRPIRMLGDKIFTSWTKNILGLV